MPPHLEATPADPATVRCMNEMYSSEVLLPGGATNDKHYKPPPAHAYCELARLKAACTAPAASAHDLWATAPPIRYFMYPGGAPAIPRGLTGRNYNNSSNEAAAMERAERADARVAARWPAGLGFRKGMPWPACRRDAGKHFKNAISDHPPFARHLGTAIALVLTGSLPMTIYSGVYVRNLTVRDAFFAAVHRLGGYAALAATVVELLPELALNAVRASMCYMIHCCPGISEGRDHLPVRDVVLKCCITVVRAGLGSITSDDDVMEFFLGAETATTMHELLEHARVVREPDAFGGMLRRFDASFRDVCQSRTLPPAMDLVAARLKMRDDRAGLDEPQNRTLARLFRALVARFESHEPDHALHAGVCLLVHFLGRPPAHFELLFRVMDAVRQQSQSRSHVDRLLTRMAGERPVESHCLAVLATMWKNNLISVQPLPRDWTRRVAESLISRHDGVVLPVDTHLYLCGVCGSPRTVVSRGRTCCGLTSHHHKLGAYPVCAGNGSVVDVLPDGRTCTSEPLVAVPLLGFVITCHTRVHGVLKLMHCPQPGCGRLMQVSERAFFNQYGPSCYPCRRRLAAVSIALTFDELRPFFMTHRGVPPQTCALCRCSLAGAAREVLKALYNCRPYGRHTAAVALHGNTMLCSACNQNNWRHTRNAANQLAPRHRITDDEIYGVLTAQNAKAEIRRLVQLHCGP